jgi:hypothetical protein
MRAAVILLAALAFGLALVGSAPGVQPGLSQIRITDRVVTEATSFDQRVIKTLLYNRGISANPIGNSVTICWAIGSGQGPIPPGALECMGTYRFAHGNLQVQGYMGRRGLYTLAIVGGTGIYANTGAGQLAVVTINLNPREQQLSFTLYST